jgi:hypothetical protein
MTKSETKQLEKLNKDLAKFCEKLANFWIAEGEKIVSLKKTGADILELANDYYTKSLPKAKELATRIEKCVITTDKMLSLRKLRANLKEIKDDPGAETSKSPKS